MSNVTNDQAKRDIVAKLLKDGKIEINDAIKLLEVESTYISPSDTWPTMPQYPLYPEWPQWSPNDFPMIGTIVCGIGCDNNLISPHSNVATFDPKILN